MVNVTRPLILHRHEALDLLVASPPRGGEACRRHHSTAAAAGRSMSLVTPDDGWRISDERWSRVEPLLPVRPKRPVGCHNPRPRPRRINAIFFVLRTGCQWQVLNATGICSTPRPIGAFRVDRGRGVLSAVAPGAARLPGAKGPRMGLASDGWGDDQGPAPPASGPARPPNRRAPQGLCLDNAYDNDEVRELLAECGFTAHPGARLGSRSDRARGRASVPAVGSSSAPTPGSIASAAR